MIIKKIIRLCRNFIDYVLFNSGSKIRWWLIIPYLRGLETLNIECKSIFTKYRLLSDPLRKKERRDFMNDLRTELAREWAKKHNIQLSLFSREYQIELKATSRERKLNKESSEKSKEICRGIEGNKGRGVYSVWKSVY